MIDARSTTLGSTPEGRDWCIKALHPSDPLNEIHGIPDESSIPSVFVGYNAQFSLGPPNLAADSWGFDMTLLPHPIAFAHLHAYDAAVAHSALINLHNPQLVGTTHAEKYASFRDIAQRWRLAYMGITIVQDSASLYNQGSIVACQTPIKPTWLTTLTGSALPAGGIGLERSQCWQASDRPLYQNCQSMPNSYFGPSKEGLYMPLRLTRTHQQWHGAEDEIQNSGVLTLPANPKLAYRDLPVAANKGWPFDDAANGLQAPYTAAGALTPGESTSALCNDVVGHICATNLSLNTQLRCYIRVGFEIQVQPGSLLTPHQSISPAYDPMAIDNYYKLNREFKDAYPEEYNSWGKMWDIISGVAKSLGPALAMIPVAGPALSVAVPAAAAVGDRIKAALMEKSSASKADTDLAAAAMKTITALPTQQVPVQEPRVRRRKGRRQASAASALIRKLEGAVKRKTGGLSIQRRS